MTAPAGNVSLAMNYLKLTLADSAAFRTWAGAANQAQALARIYNTGLPGPANNADAYDVTELEALRPFVIVTTTGYLPDYDAVLSFSESGSFRLTFFQTIPSEIADDPDEIALRLENSIGQIIADMLTLAGTAGYLDITGMSFNGDVERSHESLIQTQGDFWIANLDVNWGAAA